MRFIITFVLTVTFLASTLYGLILAVDPYNKFGYNLFGFETKAVDFARENKFTQVEHAKKKYDVFLFGSSSAHRYRTKDLNRLTGLTSYNYSTQSATPEDYIAMTRHILKTHPVKMLLISMEFEILNKNTKTDDMFYSSPLKDFLSEVPKEELEADLFNNSYLTLEAISDSFKVIWVNLFGKAEHDYLADGDHKVGKKPEKLVVKQFSSGEYEFDENRIEYLKKIRTMCEERGIKLIVFTSPLSSQHLDKINANPTLKQNHAAFKAKLVEIFGEFYDFQNYGISQYSTVDYFQDSNHPNHDFSTTVLERIFGQMTPQNPDFGKLVK